MWCDTGWSGVDWLPMAILGWRAGGADSVSTLGVGAGVCTGDGGGTTGVGCWASTVGASGGFSLGSGWVWCSVGGRKMSRMRVRSSKCLIFSVAGTSLMAHDRKWRAWNMRSSDLTVGWLGMSGRTRRCRLCGQPWWCYRRLCGSSSGGGLSQC